MREIDSIKIDMIMKIKIQERGRENMRGGEGKG